MRAIEQHDNIEYINGIIDTIEELFRLTEVPEETKQETPDEVKEEPKEEPKKAPKPAKKKSTPSKVPSQRPGTPEEKFDFDEIRAWRNAKPKPKSWEWISDEYGCSTQTVINHVKKHNKQNPDRPIK